MKIKKKYYTYIFIILCICSTSQIAAGEDDVLVKVAGRIITVNDFLRRSEYTVRPTYCKNNFNSDKKIILNSLIAEKLLAIEAGEDNPFINSTAVQTYLLGRKEQMMRYVLYNEEVKRNIKLDTLKIKNVYQYAGREYKISYVSVKDTHLVQQLKYELFDKKRTFEDALHYNYNLKKIPEKTITWNSIEHPLILDSLYTLDRKKGEVLGPLEFAKDHFMFIKINGWLNTPAITQKQYDNRYNSVKNVYEERASYEAYVEYVKTIMKDKKLSFNKDVFLSFSDIMGPIYMKSKNEQEKVFEEGVWDSKNLEMKYKNVKPRLDQIRNSKLFDFENKDWSVDDLLREIKKHPLVFREKKISKKDFGEQLQLAILDLVRDECLTKVAYARNYDKTEAVTNESRMWKDNLNSLYQKNKLLKESGKDSLFTTNYMSVLDKTLNPLIESLQKKYSDKIFINVDLFDRIKLTKIDLAVSYANSPFSQAVPTFPLVTTISKLNYGKPLK